MWDINKNRLAFVEVKGPNDRLSNKQILWLDYLSSLGLEALVCHVECLNGKRLLPKKKAAASPRKKRQRRNSDDDFK